jgi:conjugative relaxase-like TrwC/TraI family protein
VLKISKPISAEKVADYYTVEFGAADQSAYFSQDGQVRGEWHGRLAAQFGLVGGVDELHYYRLAEGQHPHSGAQLIKHRKVAAEVPPPITEPAWMTDKEEWKKHVENLFVLSERMRLPEEFRAFVDDVDPIELEGPPDVAERAEAPKKKHAAHVSAYDFTIGSPKAYSATALIGGDAGLIADHKAAVRIALDAGEVYTQARLRDTGPVTTGKWCGALFLHDTARPVDGNAPNPHLHTHGVVFNMTDAAGKMRSVQPWEWYRVQSYMTAAYQAEIAYRALGRGYELEHGRNFSTQIKGYSQEYLDAISARTKEIEAEKERLGIVGAESDERVNKRLRKPKQEWAPEALKAEHRRQAEEMGQHPEQIVAAARQREVRMLTAEERQQLAHKAIDHARDRLFEHQAVNDRYEIMRDALRYGLGHIRLQDVEQAFGQHREFVQVGHYRENAPGARYSTREMRQMERDTIDLLLAGQGTVKPIAAELTKDEFRAQYQERHRGEQKIVPNGDQMRLGYNVLTAQHQVMIVRGAAGSGKTTALEPIAEVAAARGYEVLGMASASKAAENLRTLGIEPSTIQAHNLRPVDPAERKRLYILDEGSLIGTRQFHKFVKSVRSQDRVVVAYDHRQHQAVEAGRIIEEMEQAGVATFALERIVRQRDSPELLAVINEFKDGRMSAGLRMLDERGVIHQVPDRQKRLEYMAMWYVRHPDTLMVAPDNRTIGELNTAARYELRKAGRLGADVYEPRVLVGVRDVREADRKRTASYEAGNVVRWGKGVRGLGVASGDYTPVVRTDILANRVTILVGKREVEYDPRLAYGVEIYEAERRKLAEGERIQITRPWKLSEHVRIPNRATGVIRELDAAGNAQLEMEDGRRVRWNARQMPHVDYAYATTSYVVEHATAENVLLHLDTGDSRIRTLMDKALLYVGASRGANSIHVFTDDREMLLGPESPIQRVNLKPKGLAPEEISEQSYAMGVGMAN